jgi:dolichol-phosphate mannosyltransferase
MLASIVIPIYNEETNLNELAGRLLNTIQSKLNDWQIEILLVNDGSYDSSFSIMKKLAEKNSIFKLVNLSRNFGHQIAISAGMDLAAGDVCIVMDGDLQDPPETIPELIKKWKEGFEIVYAVRNKRDGENWFKLVTAKAFYRILKRITSVEIPVDTGDFRLIDKRVLDVLKDMPEKHRFIRGMVAWSGFKSCPVYYHREKRFAGTTKFTIGKMVQFSLNGITSFSTYPLKLASTFGLFVSLVGFLYLIYVIYLALFTNNTVEGWASMMVVVLFLGGVQLLSLGIIGEYIGRINEEVKKRPNYIISEKVNF